ncbi:hypothetical protein AYO47_01845 [Planctomyces sp. SCGC AG-212-M04]|nr:hypothetical protein AYO47_01845 [Planctomyces sp. SCGC AG-212-M04]
MADQLNLLRLTEELDELKEGDPAGRVAECLKKSVRAAIKIEFATIPPYLTAMWSIRNSDPTILHPVAEVIKEIVVEEMLHMGLACNMLVGLGESPVLTTTATVPAYPGPLPGDVNPDLIITLRRLTPSQLKAFMDIEYPEEGPISALATRTSATIGRFYSSLLKAFKTAQFPLITANQRTEMLTPVFRLFKIETFSDVRSAIDLIRRQGEGSKCSPEETPGHLAHYYQFREVYEGAKYIRDPQTNRWGHTGPPVAMPTVWPMADIPPGGYQKADVPYSSVWAKIEQFNAKFTTMLRQLEQVWRDSSVSFGEALSSMYSLTTIATELIQNESEQRPDRRGTYGPCFQLAQKL